MRAETKNDTQQWGRVGKDDIENELRWREETSTHEDRKRKQKQKQKQKKKDV